MPIFSMMTNEYKAKETNLIGDKDVYGRFSKVVGDSDHLTAVASTCVSLSLESANEVVVAVEIATSARNTILKVVGATR